MASLEQLLRKREGVRYDVYKDSRQKLTVGIGHLVVTADKLKFGDTIDDSRVSDFFKKDSAKALSSAQKQAGRAKISDKEFVVYLASVNFQLGSGWYKILKKAWACIMAGKYEDAAKEVKNSRWYKQTPVRGKDFCRALLKLAGKTDGDDE